MANVQAFITNGPLDTAGDALPPADTETGAVVTFLGVVRGIEEDKPISGLEYSTYDPMAQRTLELLAHESADRFGVIAIVVEHS